MRSINKKDWVLGELLTDPQRLFVLWAIKVRFCVSPDDFRRRYGTSFPIDSIVDRLKQDGFLRQDTDKLVLTEMGEDAVVYLGDSQVSPYASGRYDKKVAEMIRLHRRSGTDLTNIITKILTKFHIAGDEYLGFEFHPEGVSTEHAGRLIYYVDLARLFDGRSYDDLDAICELMAKDIEKEQIPFDCIVGLPYVGSHIGVLLARKLNKPFAIMGKERRTRRTKLPSDFVEGYILKPGETALLFDDAIVTGTSIVKAADKLRSVGVVINHAYAFLDKQHGGTERLEQKGIVAFSLLQGEEFATALGAEGVLTREKVEAILEEAREKRIGFLTKAQAATKGRK